MKRRVFIQSILAAGVAPLVVPSRVLGSLAPSKRITMGFIGVGGHGTFNLKTFLGFDDCHVLAVCDVHRGRCEAAAGLVDERNGDRACRRHNDFRELLADPAIDAVVISTPDHWHVPMSLLALAAGKHVQCEKPTYRIHEGRTLAEAVRASGRVFQTGLEDRSVIHYHRMIEWLRNGAIGELYHADVVLPPGRIVPWEEEAPVPDGLDWNLWLGPAPWHPYTPTRTAAMHWRYIRDYSTGVLTDWGTHLVDTAQLAVNDPAGCPVEVRAWGEPPPAKAQSDIPAVYEVHYRYANGVTLKVSNAVDEERLGSKASIRLLGSKGWVANIGWRGRFEASDPEILRTKYSPETSKHWPLPPGEHRNFLDCIRSGAEPTYTAETLHRLSTTLHMGLIAMDLGRPLRWDTAKERFIDDDEANRRCERSERADWKT
jgi:predicted dehydrogenase